MVKKNITIYKTTQFFHTYPIMLFLQHNNLSVKEWSNLRTYIKQLDNIDMIVLKNSVMENIIITENFNHKEMLQFMFQGPCLAIGCLELAKLIKIIEILKKTSKFLILGAIVEKRILTHLDLKKLITLDNTIYNFLLNNVSQPNLLYSTLHNSLNFEILEQNQRNLIDCLSLLHKMRLYNNKKKGVSPTAGSPTVTLLRLRSSY